LLRRLRLPSRLLPCRQWLMAGANTRCAMAMGKGEGAVYSIIFEGLEHPGMLAVEFHGHTEQIDGAGDLMFYSKTGGSPESGTFVAPLDRIHGWYLRNDSGKEIVAKLELAGFYELQAKQPLQSLTLTDQGCSTRPIPRPVFSAFRRRQLRAILCA
jgi:hypothetical protein